MHAKKLLSMLLTALLAVTLLAGCYNSNFSKEAADALNRIQDTVAFETDSQLTQALKNALKDNVQTSAVRDAILSDENLQSLLTSGYQLVVFAVNAGNAEEAAEMIAQNAASLVAGKKSEGKIAMVLADNGYYYVVVLTWRNASSGGSDDDSSDDGGTDAPASTVTVNDTMVTAGTPVTISEGNENSYMVELQQQANGSLTVTISPKDMQDCYQITNVTIGGQTYSPNNDGSYTITDVSPGVAITVTIEDVGYSVDADGNYKVTNEKGLLVWAQAVKNAQNPDCTLLKDITLTSWTSVGNGFADPMTYAGTFDGKGHTITLQSSTGGGLFHYVAKGGVVQNLIVDLSNATIGRDAYGNVAGAIANLNYGTIQNCMAKNGTVSAMNNVGGIVGQNYGSVQGCCVINMSITSEYNQAGGIAGSNQGNCQITACCTVDCAISVDPRYSKGGIVGVNAMGADVDTCYWNGELEKGIGSNAGTASNVTKIDASTTWGGAVEAMNGKGGKFTLGADGKPDLAINTSNNPVEQLLRATRLFGL